MPLSCGPKVKCDTTKPWHISRGKVFTMRAAIELDDKATRQARTADEIEAQAAGAIYDDDPDAIEQLTAKIAKLEARREEMKAANAKYRREHPELKTMGAYERSQAIPFPRYAIANIGGTITKTRDRLKRLQREKETGPRDRIIAARFGSDCADCGAAIAKGDLIRYNRQQGARCQPVCSN